MKSTVPFGSVAGGRDRATSKDVKELRDDAEGEVPTVVPRPPKGDLSPPTDPDLARLVAAWPRLPNAIKAGIAALVQAAGADDPPASKE